MLADPGAGALTEELAAQLAAAETMVVVEEFTTARISPSAERERRSRRKRA